MLPHVADTMRWESEMPSMDWLAAAGAVPVTEFADIVVESSEYCHVSLVFSVVPDPDLSQPERYRSPRAISDPVPDIHSAFVPLLQRSYLSATTP